MNVADSAPPVAKWVNHPYAIDRSANVPVRGTEPVMDERHAAMTRAYELAADFLDTLHDRPVWPRATYQEMLEALGRELPAAGLNALAPAGAAAEPVAGAWIVDPLGLPRGTGVGLVTGAMMANYTCLSAARHAGLARHGWDVNWRRLFSAPRARVAVGRDRHDTIDRAVRFLGLGQDAVREVATDSQGRLDTAPLRSLLAPDC